VAQRVAWTESAWQELECAASFISRDSRRYAASLIEDARDAARSLRKFPRRGRVVPEADNDLVRELFVKNYRPIYEIRPDRIAILAFIHEARRFPLNLVERLEPLVERNVQEGKLGVRLRAPEPLAHSLPNFQLRALSTFPEDWRAPRVAFFRAPEWPVAGSGNSICSRSLTRERDTPIFRATSAVEGNGVSISVRAIAFTIISPH